MMVEVIRAAVTDFQGHLEETDLIAGRSDGLTLG